MRFTRLYITPAVLTLLLLASCAGQSANTPASPITSSPTIAAAQVQPAPARPTPTIAAIGGQPAATPAIQAALTQPTAGIPTFQAQGEPQGGAPAAEPSIYLWPTYLPPNMRPSPTESRVSSAGQTGEAGLGFYIITLNNGPQKLAIGGGDLSDVLPLSGDQRPITAGTRVGTLITAGDQREIVFNMARGKLFLYSAGLDEQELLKIAESLQPIDVKNLRDLAGTT
jgi:hypothetical protein